MDDSLAIGEEEKPNYQPAFFPFQLSDEMYATILREPEAHVDL